MPRSSGSRSGAASRSWASRCWRVARETLVDQAKLKAELKGEVAELVVGLAAKLAKEHLPEEARRNIQRAARRGDRGLAGAAQGGEEGALLDEARPPARPQGQATVAGMPGRRAPDAARIETAVERVRSRRERDAEPVLRGLLQRLTAYRRSHRVRIVGPRRLTASRRGRPGRLGEAGRTLAGWK